MAAWPCGRSVHQGVTSLNINIASSLFEAFLKCPTKCWLRAKNETPSGNTYAEWVQSQNESFRASQTERLLAEIPPDAFARSPSPEALKSSKWRLAMDVVAQASPPASSGSVPLPKRTPGGTPGQPADGTSALPVAVVGTDFTPSQESERRGWNACLPVLLEDRLHAVERVSSEGRGRAAQFIPIRFSCFNKLTRDDKLLLAFDAFVLSAALGREIAAGMIIHGDLRGCARESAANSENQAAGRQTGMTTAALSRAQPQVTKVKTPALASEVRQRLEKITALLSISTPPDLVLNRHCAECEFQARCRNIALEKDDLSLLAGMSAKERQKLRSKGIFTVTQLSDTFRPRRRPKRLRDKREKYHHSLKALAIRENKIHILPCYLTGAMRWVGALQVVEQSNDRSPIWTECDSPERLEVKPLIVLEPEHGVPMSELAEKAPFYRSAAAFKKFKGLLRGSPKRFRNRRDGEMILRMLYAAERTPVSRAVESKAPPAAAEP